MGKPTNILVAIPQPCNENWDKMTPTDKGRFCSECNKDVIDFTTWSDARLYAFLSRPQAQLCGRFFNTQLEREIILPSQPPGRLYRLAVAFGLTLVFTAGVGQTFARQPIVFESPPSRFPEHEDEANTDTAAISGTVIGRGLRPIRNAVVKLTMNSRVVGSVKTDKEGRYSFQHIGEGTYGLTINARGYQKKLLTGINATSDNTTLLQYLSVQTNIVTATSGMFAVHAVPAKTSRKKKKQAL